jgi:carbamoyl-phosphate synthase large subunit
MDYLEQKRIDLVINIPKSSHEDELTNDYLIRRKAVDFGVPLITDIHLAQRFVESLARKTVDDLLVKSCAEYGTAAAAAAGG